MPLELLESNLKDEDDGLPWGECVLCGNLGYTGQFKFKNGTVAPQVNEVVSGAVSNCTGIVSHIFLQSGSWAGGNAAGVIQVTAPTNYDSIQLALFADGETITGSLGGQVLGDGIGTVSISGKQYSRNQVVVYNGKQYCLPHWRYMYQKQLISDAHIDINEDIRFLPWT